MVRIHRIVTESFVDGPGRRSVVFFQGCPIHCQGCQNRSLWDAAGGNLYDEEPLAQRLAFLSREHGNVTISGGEPFAQVASLAKLVYYLRREGVAHIIVYSGYELEILMNPLTGVLPWVKETMERIDVLVDGPFIARQDDALITYRGSRNQRPIDVVESVATGKVVTLDWDEPEIVLTTSGDALMPIGMTAVMSNLGTVIDTRMCGQITF